jgi:hypothetical protein
VEEGGWLAGDEGEFGVGVLWAVGRVEEGAAVWGLYQDGWVLAAAVMRVDGV